MDFVKMQHILAVAEIGNFSRAAEKCFISQPALTRSVSKTEESLNVKLFDRTTTPVTLTAAGKKYVDGIRSILLMKRQLDDDMAALSSQKNRSISLGIPSTRSLEILPAIMPSFLEKHPDISIHIHEGFSATLEEALVKEEIDVSIFNTLPIMQPGLDYEVLHEEQLAILLPPTSHLFNGEEITFYEDKMHFLPAHLLDGYPYVSVASARGLYRAGQDMFEFFNIHPRTVMSLSSSYTAYHVAAEGMGFAIAPASNAMVLEYKTKPVFCSLFDPPYKRSLVASWKKDKPMSEAVRIFIEHVKRKVPEIKCFSDLDKSVVYDLPFSR